LTSQAAGSQSSAARAQPQAEARPQEDPPAQPQPGARPQEDLSAQSQAGAEFSRHVDVAVRSMGLPNSVLRQFDFWDDAYEWRRLFSELLGTFFLVLVAAGAGMVNARFGGHAIPPSAQVVAPALMVMVIILFMGAVSGAHLNPAVSISFALRGNFPWKRVPLYIVAQLAGAILATLTLWALVGKHGSAGLTLPGPGISTLTAMLWEALLTVGLVSVILGTASGAQQLGPLAALGVGGYIALAGLWGAPVSGASMNPARSLGPALVLGDWTSWWAYLLGPVIGGLIAVGIAFVLRGAGGGAHGTQAAQGTLGVSWRLGRIGPPELLPEAPRHHARGSSRAASSGSAGPSAASSGSAASTSASAATGGGPDGQSAADSAEQD
jgi:aquaporin Z